jgi:hypothetical protein
MATVTYTATLPNGELAHRSTKTMEYVACLAIADKGGDNWGARSWHLTTGAAIAAANSGYIRDNYNSKVIEVEITKVVGKTVPGTDLHDMKAALAAGVDLAQYQAGLLLPGDDAPADVPSEADVDATAEAFGAVLTGTQTVEEATAFLDTVQEAFTAAIADAKADLAARMTLAQKQELGSNVHALVRTVLADLPAGIDPAEADTVVTKWLSYIPRSGLRSAPARMTLEQKRVLGGMVHAKAAQALADLPAGVNPDAAADVVGKWMSYIPAQG